MLQDLTVQQYKVRKEAAADAVMERVEAIIPGLRAATVFREVGTPRTHRRFLGRQDGSYGPIPSRRPLGMLGMPLNRTGMQVSLSLTHISLISRLAAQAACLSMLCAVMAPLGHDCAHQGLAQIPCLLVS